MIGWLAFALLLVFALGYATHKWLTERPAAPPQLPPTDMEWTPGDFAGLDTVYNVRLSKDE